MMRVVRLLQRLPAESRPVLETCVYGLAAGVAAVAFQLAVSAVYRLGLARLAGESKGTFIVGSLGVILLTSLAVGYLLHKFCPDARGSGIPQLKLAFWKDFGFVPWRVVWVKFVAGVLSLGGGASLGREGPSVQLAGGLASNVAGWLGEPKQRRRLAASAGAAAGLAAAFNTPLAAITFVLEEIIQNLHSRMLGSVLLASVIGALVVHGVIGEEPAFSLGDTSAATWRIYLMTPVVAAAAALIGVVFHQGTLRLRRRRLDVWRLPLWMRPAFGGFITWALGATVFAYTGHLGVFSLGYDDLSAGLAHQLAWQLAGVLLVTKLVATICCYGFGGCGGIFSPCLFLGGMCGLCLGGLAEPALALNSADHIVLGVVGMSACLGAVVRAPVTGILIVFEMTHNFALVPALMLGALVSQAIGRSLCAENFYDALLAQDGHVLHKVIPPRTLKSWRELPVSAIATFDPVVASDLSAAALAVLLRKQPYERFPVVQADQLQGVLTRDEAQSALREQRAPRLEPAVTCLPHDSIAHLQSLLLESTSLVVIVLDRPGGKPIGLVTLHDLLRAEEALAGKSVE